MKAKEMFEEVGYELERNNDCYLQFKRNDEMLIFAKEYKEYWVEDYRDGIAVSIRAQEHQAITQQMKELGWIK